MKSAHAFIWLMAWATAGAPAYASDNADALAKGILEKAQMHPTVCEMPRVGDGTLAAALAKQSGSVVQALAPDAPAAAAARKPASDAKVLGSQVIVETGSASAIPLQDWVADLLVVADATDANLQEIPPAQVKRVLSPYRGVAVVGQPQGGPGGLTAAGLTAWANQLGGTADVKQDDTGLWAVIKMPALAGGDDWSHYYHGPDGNPVSQDTVVKGPQFGLQWMGGPYWAGKFDVHVAAAGREFHAQSTIYWRHGWLPFLVRARSLYNGEILWERKIAADFGDIGSLMVATADRLYLKDGSGVLALDAETGKELLRIGDKDNGGDCKWLMFSDGVLVTMNGPKRTKEWSDNGATGKTHEENQDYENETFYATDMDAWDAASGKNLWQFKDDRIDPAKTVIRDGHIYFYANYAYAACMDLKTGQQLWKTPAPISDPKNPGMGLGWALNEILTPRQSAIAMSNVYFINSHAHLQSVAFDAATGKMLWQKMHGKTGNAKKTADDAGNDLLNYPVAIGGKLFDQNWRWRGWDPLTGKILAGPILFHYFGCGHFTATESGLLFGQCGGIYDSPDKKWEVSDTFSKAACGVSQFAADGTVVKVPSDCGGCTEWRGFMVTHNADTDAPSAERLEKGPAYDESPSAATADPSDWPTYRSTSARCASSTSLLPASDAIRWTFAPPPSTRKVDPRGDRYSPLPRTEPAPPIAVGDQVFLGTADGAIVCLDRATGAEKWRYWTGGQIMSSPTWDHGRLYAGSSDGWLYCLAADSGELAWRYRVAPLDRRIMVFGRLSSPWPILASPLVEDGVAYAAGGIVGTLDGSVLCAIDARTGQMKWAQESRIDSRADTNGIVTPSADGQLTWDHGRLWWHVADSGIRVVDPATGKVDLAPSPAALGMNVGTARGTLNQSFSRARGQDIGILPGGWVVVGGFQFFLPPSEMEQPSCQCVFLQTDSDGLATGNALTLVKAQHRDFVPAWNATDALVGGSFKWYGDTATPMKAVYWHGFADSLDADAKTHSFKINPKPTGWINLTRESKLIVAKDGGEQVMPDHLATNDYFRWFTPVLAENGSVFIGRTPHGWGYDWTVYSFGRPGQTLLGKVPLPAQPLLGGMSLTRAGDVLVPLIDGRLVCIGAADKAAPK